MEYNYIKCGDCLNLMRGLPSESIDLTITSPPYDNLREYNGYSFDFENIAEELYRITKLGGVVVWIVNDATIKGSETGTSFKQALYFKEVGFNLHDTMIWYKGSCPFPDKKRYYQSFEYMFVLAKGEIKTFEPITDRKNKHGGTKVHGTLRQSDGSLKQPTGIKTGREVKEFGSRFNMWQISPERNNKTGHPAVFPEQLVNDHIISWSKPGDVVLDPFIGTGTTAVACINTGRHYIGFEISKEYCEIARERIKNALKVRGLTD